MVAVAKISRRRKNTIASEVAGVIRLAFAAGEITTVWGLEGSLQASLRADLCLRGWSWRDADQAAKDIVAGAHRLIGAERPSWAEGQRGHAQPDITPDAWCRNCAIPLKGRQVNYCSIKCARAWWRAFNAAA